MLVECVGGLCIWGNRRRLRLTAWACMGSCQFLSNERIVVFPGEAVAGKALYHSSEDFSFRCEEAFSGFQASRRLLAIGSAHVTVCLHRPVRIQSRYAIHGCYYSSSKCLHK